MYKIPDEVIKCIQKTMENWIVDLLAGEKCLAELKKKIQKCIFQGNAQSGLLFVIAMKSLQNILRKCLLYMDDIKLFAEKWEIIRNPNTGIENIQSRHGDGIWHRKAENDIWRKEWNNQIKKKNKKLGKKETGQWHNGQSVRQWPGRPRFNPRWSHTKASKMVLYATLINTQHYKVRIKGKVE